MTGDYQEKYLRLSAEFTGRAGQLATALSAQRRLITSLSKRKALDEDMKALLVSVAESVEVSESLLDYTHKMLHGVGEDAKALCEGAKMRNTIKWQSQLIEEFLDAKNDHFVSEIKNT